MAPSIWSNCRKTAGRQGKPDGDGDPRTPFEKDHDRLLFSTPVRRLADKTQVFPLERNDSVRNRLTHSHEVSNLARSIGIRLLRTDATVFGDSDEARSAAPVILATVGLAHDLGNPPFGHQGEVAIAGWFRDNDRLFDQFRPGTERSEPDFVPVPEEQRADFTRFEGNAQGLRLVSRLQNTLGTSGLNLTAATLAALMKYPVASHEIDRGVPSARKHGYFYSEEDVVEWIREQTGLRAGQRHPLTWVMEASDDIAYSVMDIEDAIKKGLISAEDVLAYLRGEFRVTDLGGLINQLTDDFRRADEAVFSLSRVREIKATYLRTRLIARLVSGASRTYLESKDSILGFGRVEPLLGCGTDASRLCAALKRFARVHAYNSADVLELECVGSRVIQQLMDAMWHAISERERFTELDSRRTDPRAGFVYSLISDSYRWHFERESADRLTTRYKELQLLGDMISGMTDGYAMDLHRRIRRIDSHAEV